MADSKNIIDTTAQAVRSAGLTVGIVQPETFPEQIKVEAHAMRVQSGLESGNAVEKLQTAVAVAKEVIADGAQKIRETAVHTGLIEPNFNDQIAMEAHEIRVKAGLEPVSTADKLRMAAVTTKEVIADTAQKLREAAVATGVIQGNFDDKIALGAHEMKVKSGLETQNATDKLKIVAETISTTTQKVVESVPQVLHTVAVKTGAVQGNFNDKIAAGAHEMRVESGLEKETPTEKLAVVAEVAKEVIATGAQKVRETAVHTGLVEGNFNDQISMEAHEMRVKQGLEAPSVADKLAATAEKAKEVVTQLPQAVRQAAVATGIVQGNFDDKIALEAHEMRVRQGLEAATATDKLRNATETAKEVIADGAQKIRTDAPVLVENASEKLVAAAQTVSSTAQRVVETVPQTLRTTAVQTGLVEGNFNDKIAIEAHDMKVRQGLEAPTATDKLRNATETAKEVIADGAQRIREVAPVVVDTAANTLRGAAITASYTANQVIADGAQNARTAVDSAQYNANRIIDLGETTLQATVQNTADKMKDAVDNTAQGTKKAIDYLE